MAAKFEKTYQDAIDSGKLPGIALLATNQDGTFTYSKCLGTSNLSTGAPMTLQTILCLASCTKLMTAIAAQQLLAAGKLSLDDPVSDKIPSVGALGIITGFDDSGSPKLHPASTPITLRHLLTHTSGYVYDAADPQLLRWHASRQSQPWSAPTLEGRNFPLTFEPGTRWGYGISIDWVGRLTEIVSGLTLEDYMRKNIWDPLGLKNITFWPKKNGLEDQLAGMAFLGPDNKSVHIPSFELASGVQECLGGQGVYTSTETYMELLRAVMRQDEKLLSAESWKELSKPRLEKSIKDEFNQRFREDEWTKAISMSVPEETEKDWCFAGLLTTEDIDGWMKKDTMLWGGIPCLHWFVDRTAGLAGLCAPQVFPPMVKGITDLHKDFQQGIYKEYEDFKARSQ